MSFFDMIQSFDTSVLEFIQNTFKCSFLDPIMAFFSYMGEMGLFWIAVGIVFIIFKKTRSMGVMMLVAMAIGFLVGEIGIKNLINRPRPFMVNIDYSARPSELNPDFGLNIAIPSGRPSVGTQLFVTCGGNRYAYQGQTIRNSCTCTCTFDCILKTL